MSGNPGQIGRAQSSFLFINKISEENRYTVAHTYSHMPDITNGNPGLNGPCVQFCQK